jgi:hypothetical protein
MYLVNKIFKGTYLTAFTSLAVVGLIVLLLIKIVCPQAGTDISEIFAKIYDTLSKGKK